MDNQHLPIKANPLLNSVLVYDGDCGFCNASLSWAYKRLRIMPAAEPYQTADLSQYGLTLKDVESAVFLIDGRHRFRGHLAIGRLFAYQEDKLLRIVGKILTIKLLSPFFALGYILVAKNRRFLPGATEACGKRPPHSK